MSIVPIARRSQTSPGSERIAGWTGRLAGAVLLALGLCLAAGLGQAHAAVSAPTAAGTLAFTKPSYQGLIGGPPGTRVTVRGSSWEAYGTVELSLSTNARSCSGAVPAGSFAITGSGSFSASFLWPAAANQVGAYYACGYQQGRGIAISHTTFSVLASSPATVSFAPANLTAGSILTVSGNNWVPGPQQVLLSVVSCKTSCQAASVAQAEITTGRDGTFHQQLTISTSATSGSYYVQATNTVDSLSATSTASLQVTGQVTPGASVTPTPTPLTNGAHLTAPPSQAKSALKDALLAAGVGLLVALVVIGGLAFFVRRSRGADAPIGPATRREEGALEGEPESSRGAIWRATPVSRYDTRLELPAIKPYQNRPSNDSMFDEDVYTVPGQVLPGTLVSGDRYPWERQKEKDAFAPPEEPDEPQANASIWRMDDEEDEGP